MSPAVAPKKAKPPVKRVANKPVKKPAVKRATPSKTAKRKPAKKKKQRVIPVKKIALWSFLLLMLIVSIATTFFMVFFSVPNVQAATKPTIAIIIDDMGYDRNTGFSLIKLPYNISYSFLPFTPSSEFLQEEARVNGRDIMLHLALEPQGRDVSLEPTTVKLTDSPENQLKLLKKNLSGVPRAIGINNHMGSLFTENNVAMDNILTAVDETGLFFIDSLTSSDSVGYETARALGIASRYRDIFLDNIRTEQAICKQLDKLVLIAEKKGSSVGIGHPYKETLAALKRCLPEVTARVEIKPISEML